MSKSLVQKAEIEPHQLSGEEFGFPNNPKLPLLLYRGALRTDSGDLAPAVEDLLESNDWSGSWRNGVLPHHHFHSNAHEVLAVCAGSARIQFGGPAGPVISAQAGDVAILPAGTAHKNVSDSAGFLVVGAYPIGQEDYDMMHGDPQERERAAERIGEVPLPSADPIYGDDGPIFEHWKGPAR